MHLLILSPRVRGGEWEGTTPGKLTKRAVSWVGILKKLNVPTNLPASAIVSLGAVV